MVDRGVRRVDERRAARSRTSCTATAGASTPGHRIRIEIAQDDDPYLRGVDASPRHHVTHVTLAMPVRETPATRARRAPPRSGRPRRVQAVHGPDRPHGGPLALGSCNPPQQASDRSRSAPRTPTVRPPTSRARCDSTRPGDPATSADEADVRSPCGHRRPQAERPLRLHGRAAGDRDPADHGSRERPDENEPGTAQDTTSRSPSRAARPPRRRSAHCAVTTTADAIIPGAVREGARSTGSSERSRSSTAARMAPPETARTRCSRTRASSPVGGPGFPAFRRETELPVCARVAAVRGFLVAAGIAIALLAGAGVRQPSARELEVQLLGAQPGAGLPVQLLQRRDAARRRPHAERGRRQGDHRAGQVRRLGGPPAEAADAASCRAPTRRRRRARRRHLDSDDPASAGGLSADRDDARLLQRTKTSGSRRASTRPASTGTTTMHGSPRADTWS